MKNKKLLYGLLGIGALAGFYFWNKNKKSATKVFEQNQILSQLENTTQAPIQTPPILSTLNKKVCPTKINDVKENVIKQNNSSYDDTIIGKNTIIEDARIFILPQGGLLANFSVNKLNEFDGGGRQAKLDEFEILEVTNISCRQQIDKVLTPYAVERFDENNGFKVSTGDIVKIKLLKDVKNSIPNKIIIYT